MYIYIHRDIYESLYMIYRYVYDIYECLCIYVHIYQNYHTNNIWNKKTVFFSLVLITKIMHSIDTGSNPEVLYVLFVEHTLLCLSVILNTSFIYVI